MAVVTPDPKSELISQTLYAEGLAIMVYDIRTDRRTYRYGEHVYDCPADIPSFVHPTYGLTVTRRIDLLQRNQGAKSQETRAETQGDGAVHLSDKAQAEYAQECQEPVSYYAKRYGWPKLSQPSPK